LLVQTQPIVQAAEPASSPSGPTPNRPAANVPADPPVPADVPVIHLPAKSPPKLASSLDSLLQARAASNNAPMSPEQLSVRAGLAPSGPGSLSVDANNNPVLDVRVVSTAQNVLDDLTALGADILSVSPAYRNVTLAIDVSRIVDLTRLSSVESVMPVVRPIVGGELNLPFNAVAAAPAERPAEAHCGSVISEGDTQLGAESARSQFNVDGSGVKVGVLSDSYAKTTSPTSANGDILTGDLPGPGNPCGRTTPVQVLKDTVNGIDEGRAMLQAVHDLAPGASLAFATADVSETDFANQITALQAAGATVITDDVTYFAEPFYQDGPIAVAATNARAAGAILTSSAGNSNASFNGYETQAYRPVACQLPVDPTLVCHNFSGSGVDTTYDFRLAAGAHIQVDYQWAEPRFGVVQDFDIILFDTTTNTLLASSVMTNPTTQIPWEIIDYTNNSGAARNVAIALLRFSGATPRMKFMFFRTSGISNVQFAVPNAAGDTVGATILGHNGAASEITTAATPFNDGVNPEPFTSHGPMTILFGPVNGTTPASPVSPVNLIPDITATDGGANTFFLAPPSNGVYRFFGTSQAAPHAAGVLALMRQWKPASSPDQLKAALTSSATPMNGPAAAVGAGRANAVGALNALGPVCPSPRPNIGRAVIPINAGRLQVNLTTTAGGFTAISPTGLTNASFEVNNVTLGVGQVAQLAGPSATFFVQRTGGSGAFTARLNVVDACGTYPLFFGKGS
jgi:hypothetical protein